MNGFPCPVPVELVTRLAGVQGAMLLLRAKSRGLHRLPWALVSILAGRYVADIEFQKDPDTLGPGPPSIRIVLGVAPEARAT